MRKEENQREEKNIMKERNIKRKESYSHEVNKCYGLGIKKAVSRGEKDNEEEKE